MSEELTLRNTIEMAIKTEDVGAAFYSRLSEKFNDNPQLQELFSILARDEEGHRRQFGTLLENLPDEKGISASVESKEYLQALSVTEFFKDSEEIETKEDALARAFAFEKASILYYQGIEDILGENEYLNRIIKAEKRHLISIMKNMIIEGSKFRGLADRW